LVYVTFIRNLRYRCRPMKTKTYVRRATQVKRTKTAQILLPKDLAQRLELQDGGYVAILERPDGILIKPIKLGEPEPAGHG